ncbi:MAG: hypothetical protein IJS08_04460 [Victivallales bacterium]|nr:hypothetical protein [Victivallales bacterium]
MSMKLNASFPQLDSSCFKIPSFSFSFIREGNENQLEAEGPFENGTIVVKSNYWSSRDHNLKVKVEGNLDCCGLFKSVHSDDADACHAVAADDAVLELALNWRLPNSIQGVVHGPTITSGANELPWCIEHDFANAVIHDNVELEVCLYLKQPGRDNGVFADFPGAKLGSLYLASIEIDSPKGFFPIEYCDDRKANEPLWEISSSINDEEDLDQPFRDCFCLRLNRKHPDFKELTVTEKGISPLLFEIFADACTCLVSEVCQKIDISQKDIDDYPMDSLGYSVVSFWKRYLGSFAYGDLANKSFAELGYVIRERLSEIPINRAHITSN